MNAHMQHHADDDQSSSSSIASDQDTLGIGNGRNAPLRQENFESLNSSLEGLHVGSLPCSRRHRRMMISTGGNEVLSFVGQNNHYYSRDTRPGRRRKDDMTMAQSMPNAPFLRSRKDYDNSERLSRMPSMNLPESASETVEANATTYGSLRESHFNLIDMRKNNTNNDFKVSNGGGNNLIDGRGSLPTPGGFNYHQDRQQIASSYKGNPQMSFSHQPLSSSYLNAQRFNTNIQRNYERNDEPGAKNKSVLASLLGDTTTTKTPPSSNDRATGGIGSLVHSDSVSNHTPLRNGLQNDGRGSKMSSPHSNRNEGQLVDQQQQDVMGSSHNELSAMKPSRSLTGLDILSSSRQSPGGLGITLTPEEKESAIHRARSMSGDGSMFILPTSSSQSPNNYSQSRSPMPHLLAPKNLLLGGTSNSKSSLNSMNSGDGYSSRRNRPPSPPPDTFSAFDLDMS